MFGRNFCFLASVRCVGRKLDAGMELTFRVEPLGPISRCLRFTNRSLFLTRVPILMMSHAMSSCNIRTAWKQMSVMRTLKRTVFLLLSLCIYPPPSCMTAALCTWAQRSSPVRMGHSGPEAWWDLWLLQWRTGQTFSWWCKLWHCPRSDRETLWYAEENMNPCYTKVQQHCNLLKYKNDPTVRISIVMNLLPLLRLSPRVASTLSDRLLCIWGRGWQSCSLPADHGGCHLWWMVALSIHQEQSGAQIHPLHDTDVICFIMCMHKWTSQCKHINTCKDYTPCGVINDRYHLSPRKMCHTTKCKFSFKK